MKTVNYIMVAVVVTLGFSGCYDLDVACLLYTSPSPRD